MDQTFPKSKRIVSGDHFTLVLRKGGCAADDCLVVFALPNVDVSDDQKTDCRLGVTIPKKTGNAVMRNQWKRWIREAFRTQQDAMPPGYDLVVRPKKGAQPGWEKIRRSMAKLPRKAVQRIRS